MSRIQMNETRAGKQARRLRPRRPYRATGAWLLGAPAPRAARGQPPRGIRAALHPRWIAAFCVASSPGLLAACGDNAEPPPNPAQVTDSAGIAIVTSAPANAVYATVAPEPVLSIGVLEGPDELMFGQVASVALDGAGNVVVADLQSNEIRVFGPEGAHLRTLGGAGEGPGEFERLNGAWPIPGGTIVAVDNRVGRITRFGPDGELLGAEAFQGTGLVGPIGLAGSNAVLSRVRSLPSPRGAVTASGGLDLSAMTAALEGGTEFLLRHGLDGVLIDTVATLSAAVTQMTASGSGEDLSIQLMRVPFSPNPYAASSTAGRIAVTAGDSYEILLYGPDGALERIVRLAEEPPLRTEAHLEAWVRASVTGGHWDDAELRATMRSYEEMPMPDRLPAWDGLLIADNGEIWARRYSIRGADTIVRDVFSAEGGHLGTVTTPANLGRYLEQVVDGRLVVIATDDLGVERVQIHELH